MHETCACISPLLSVSGDEETSRSTPRGEGQDQRAEPEAFSRAALLGTVAWGWPVLRSCRGYARQATRWRRGWPGPVGLGGRQVEVGPPCGQQLLGTLSMTLPGPGDQHKSHFHLSHSLNDPGEETQEKGICGSVQLSMGENGIQPRRSPRGWAGDGEKQGPQVLVVGSGQPTPCPLRGGQRPWCFGLRRLGFGLYPMYTTLSSVSSRPRAQHLPPQPGVTPGAS